jgi:prostaglandin-H2 D-isomerase / glutathione transferase
MKLVYFNGRGLAETSRILLELSGSQYEDFRYPFEIIDWATHDIVREEFLEDKAEGKLKLSMDKLPFLEIAEDVVICQSKAIERYLANTFKFMGSTGLERAFIDSICECVRDFKTEYQTIRKSKDKEKAMETWFVETLPKNLEKLDVLLTGEVGCSVGNTLSLADITIYSFLTDFFDNKEGAKNAYSSSEKIKQIIENVANNEKIIAWKQSRPETPF